MENGIFRAPIAPLDLPGIFEARFIQFGPTDIGALAADFQLGSRQLTSGLGFLWTGTSIDATSDAFRWSLTDSFWNQRIVDLDELVHANTFSGDGTVQANKTPTEWPTGGGMFFPGNSTIRINITDESNATNTINFTLTGMMVRHGSPFFADLKKAIAYISPDRAGMLQ